MLPNTDNELPVSASRLVTFARGATTALVEREEIKTGSRMVAYEVVASMVGRSESWVRKFVGGCPTVKPDIAAFLNIKAHYERIVSRIEQDTELRRIRTRMLNAAVASIDKLDTRLDSRAEGEQELPAQEGTLDARPKRGRI